MDFIKGTFNTILLNFAVGIIYLVLSPAKAVFSSNSLPAQMSEAFFALPDYWIKGFTKVPDAVNQTFTMTSESFANLPFSLITWAALFSFIFLASLILFWFLTEEKTKATLAILTTLCANILFLEAYFLPIKT